MSILSSKAVLGALVGASIALIWIAWGGAAVLLVVAFAAIGWLIGMIFQRPDVLIQLLERIRDR